MAPRSSGGRRGVVAIDVDGVLLRPIFLSRAARLAGMRAVLVSLRIGALLKLNLISVRVAAERAYALHRGKDLADLVELGRSLKLVRGARLLVTELKRAGYTVVLVSSGVPQQVAQVIADRLGADGASGILLEEADGRLTGRLRGDRHSIRGKRLGLESYLRSTGVGWSDTTVIADDRSNVEIVEAAWRSVGVNPELAILQRASFVVYTSNLSDVLEFFPEGYRAGITPERLAVKHEVFRKGIHAACGILPIVVVWPRALTLSLVGGVTALFGLSELLRLFGIALPVFSTVTWRSMRATEPRRVVAGPLLFGMGIWCTLLLFRPGPAAAGLLVLAMGDSAASVVGRAFGRNPLRHNPGKTFEGSLGLFAVSVVVAAFFVSLPWALVVGATATLIESVAMGGYDNLFLPIVTAGAVTLAQSLG